MTSHDLALASELAGELRHDAGSAFAPEAGRSRAVAAALLRAAGNALDTLARRVAAPADTPVPASADPLFEFHAEAGAPEGALYVNGSFVGHVGVTRL